MFSRVCNKHVAQLKLVRRINTAAA